MKIGKVIKKVLLLIFIFFSFLFVNNSILAKEYSSNDLKNGVEEIEELNFISQGYLYSIKKFFVHENYVFVIGGADDGTDVYDRYGFESFPYVACYENNVLKWFRLVKEYGAGIFTNMIFEENGVVIIGTVENQEVVPRLGIFNYDYNGNLRVFKDMIGNRGCTAMNIFKRGKEYLICGTTNATDFSPLPYAFTNGMYIASFNERFERVNIKVIANNGSNAFSSPILVDNKLYFIFSPNGTGMFTTDTAQVIACFDNFDEPPTYISTELIEGNLLYCFGKIISYKINKSDKKIKMFAYSENLELLDNVLVPYDSDYYLFDAKSIGSTDSQAIYLAFSNRIADNLYHYKLIMLDENYQEIFNEFLVSTKSDRNMFSTFSGGYIYLCGFTNFANPGEIFGTRHLFLKSKEGDCYINGFKAEKEVEKLETEIYGKYTGNINYSLENVSVSTTGDVFIEAKVSIKNNEVYDLGYVLSFNGDGYLNNKKINNNYVLNEEGFYVFELKGVELNTYYMFEVRKLSLDLDCKHEILSPIITEKPSEKITYTPSKILYGNLNYQQTVVEESDNYFIVIVVGCIGLLLGAFIPKWRKKDV